MPIPGMFVELCPGTVILVSLTLKGIVSSIDTLGDLSSILVIEKSLLAIRVVCTRFLFDNLTLAISPLRPQEHLLYPGQLSIQSDLEAKKAQYQKCRQFLEFEIEQL